MALPSLHRVSVDELKAVLTRAELQALPRAVASDEVDAWLQGLLLQSCDRVVGAVNACGRNERILTGLCRVPAECVHLVLVLARHAVISSMPAMDESLEGGSRSAEYNAALRDLEALSRCELEVSYALGEEEMSGSGPDGVSILGKHVSDWMI